MAQDFSPILKRLYPSNKVERACIRNSPFLGLVSRKADGSGDFIVVPVQYGEAGGRSADFTVARAGAHDDPGLAKFIVPWKEDYGLVGLTEKDLATAQGGEAIVSALQLSVDSTLKKMAGSVIVGLYGNGGGAVGQVGSGQASKTITLKNKSDIVHFKKGDKLDGSATDGTSGGVIPGGAESVIASVDYDNGTITKEGGGNWNTAAGINGIATDGYLFKKGDFGVKMYGLGAWIPPAAPMAGDSFCGVDRSVSTLLSGHRIAAQATILDTILAADERLQTFGGTPDVCIVNPAVFRRLASSLGNAITRTNKANEKLAINFSGIEITGQSGTFTVISDPYCPSLTGFLLTMETWRLISAGGAVPHFLGQTSKIQLHVDDASPSQSARIGYFANLTCNAPWRNARMTFPAATLSP